MLSISVYIYLSLSISTYIYLCLSISVYICLYLSISIYIYLYLSMSIYIYLYIYLDLSISISMYLHLSPCISIYLYLYLSLAISIYLYLFLSISIYLYLPKSIYIYLYLSISIYILALSKWSPYPKSQEFPALAALSKCFRRSGETSRIRPWLYAGADVGWQSRDWPRENQSLVLQSMAPGVSEKMWYSPKPWHSTASQQLAAGSSNCWKPAATFQPKRAKNLSWSLDLSAAVRSWRPLIVLAISVLEHYGLLRVSH